MALQKQMLSVPMSLGMDTEDIAPLIENDRFALLSNVVFDKDSKGQLHKRFGHNALTTAKQGGGFIPAAQLISIFNEETCALAGGGFYGLSTTGASPSWQLRGNLPMVQEVETNVAAGAFSVANPDAVILNGFAYYSYEMNGQSWVKVVDDTNKSVKRTIQLLTTGGLATFTPKLVSTGSAVIALSTTSAGVMWATQINASTYAPTFTNIGISPDVSPGTSETCFDAIVIGTTLYVAFISAFSMKVTSFTASTLAFIANSIPIASQPAPSPVSCANMSGQGLCVTWQTAQNAPIHPGQFQAQIYTNSAFALGTGYSFGFGVATAVTPRLATAGITTALGQNYVVAFYEQVPSGSSILSSIYYSVLLSFASTPVLWTTGTNISGLPFLNSGNLYLPVIYPSLVQQTLFLLYQSFSGIPSGLLAQVAGRYLSSNNAGAAPSNFRIPQSFVNGSAQCLPVVVQPQGTAASSVSASLSELTLTFNAALNSAQLGGDQHLALGSMLMDYDGTNLVEHNFHLFPETPTIGYLTSQLTVITDSYDPTCGAIGASQGSFRIAIPDNAANPGGPVGQLITPGEYITFMAGSYNFATHTGPPQAYAPIVFYFRVSGITNYPATGGTSAPVIVGSPTTVPIDITAQMTAVQLATAIFNVLNLWLSGVGTYVVTYTPTTQAVVTGSYVWTPQMIGLVSVAQGGSDASAITPPVLSRISTSSQVFIGNDIFPIDMLVGLSFPPASLISSGQYVSFSIPNSGSTSYSMVYFWFSNNGETGGNRAAGGDPKPFGVLANSATINQGFGNFSITYDGTAGTFLGSHIGAQVLLSGSESEQQVATLVANAFNTLRLQAASPGPFFPGTAAITQTGNSLLIQSATTASAGVSVAGYPTTNVGLGYVGGLVDGVSGATAINYVAVREWIDSQNQLHEGAPSVPVTAYIPTYVTNGTGGGIVTANSPVPVSAAVQLSVQPLSQTLKTSALTGTDLDIAIYRTISGATVGNQVYYRVTPSTAPLFNQPSSTSALTYADYSSDTSVQSNQLLYTTGGVIPNSAPPACSYILNHQNRLWLAGLENPDDLWYSETWQSGFAVNFSNLQQVLLNPIVGTAVGGPIVALASMDSYLIIFQENQIWFVQGNGPDPTGANGFYSPPQIVASSSQIGCRDPASVVLQPNGVMFKSTQGFWLLGRDLSLKYIGAAVKAYNSDVVTSACALTQNTQVNFLSNTGTTLTYDWYYDSWGTFTTQGLDSVNDAFGNFTFVTSNGAIWVQVPNQYIDGDGTPVIMSVTTAWLKTNGIQGFGRVWKAFLEGYFYGSQPYSIQIAYNYVTTPVDNFTFNNGAGGTTIGLWGGSPTWGAFIWGEDGTSTVTYSDQIQLVVYPSNQPCESIQFTITDLPPVPANNTWSLNALDLELGVRRGGMKRLGNNQRVG